jgi:hypothetical protein
MDISELTEKLPPIGQWIDDLLARHRALARRVDLLALPRLSNYYAAETLSSAYVVEAYCVPMPPLNDLGLPGFADFEGMDSDGITYRDVYFLKSERAGDLSLHFHELVHIVQWQVLGFERFMLAYALGHVLSGGYARNPLETFAYQLQDGFERGACLTVEPLVRAHLDRVVPVLFGAAGK